MGHHSHKLFLSHHGHCFPYRPGLFIAQSRLITPGLGINYPVLIRFQQIESWEGIRHQCIREVTPCDTFAFILVGYSLFFRTEEFLSRFGDGGEGRKSGIPGSRVFG